MTPGHPSVKTANTPLDCSTIRDAGATGAHHLVAESGAR
jgi:hypothetical protein